MSDWLSRVLGIEVPPDGELRVPGPAHVRELYFRAQGRGAAIAEPLVAGGRRAAFAIRDPDGRVVRVVWEGSS